MPGIFSIGDVRSGSVKHVGAAVGEGAAVVALLHGFLARACLTIRSSCGVPVHVDDGLGERIRSFLRDIVADVIEDPVRVLP